jgi:hypothetical protein
MSIYKQYNKGVTVLGPEWNNSGGHKYLLAQELHITCMDWFENETCNGSHAERVDNIKPRSCL